MPIEDEIAYPETGTYKGDQAAKRAFFNRPEQQSPIETAMLAAKRLDDFWEMRPELQHIRDVARASMAPPWAVLGASLCRVSCTIPHWITLPPIVGGEASINIYAALAGPPSSGKTVALKASRVAVPLGAEWEPWTVPLGSGEGVSAQYVQWVREKGEEPRLEYIRREVLFTVDEAESLDALKQRSGSTVGETLRRGWTGEALGFANRSMDTRLMMGSGEYRMCVVAGVQPATAHSLLSEKDFGTGLAQRFVWFDATDPKAPDETPEMPAALGWEPPTVLPTGKPSVPFSVAPAIVKVIRADRLPALRGEENDPKRQHRNLHRLKLAAVFAWIDRRRNVVESDWDLAGIVMDHSDGLREKLLVEGIEARRRAAIGRATGRIEADDEAMRKRCADRVEMLLKNKPPMSRRELSMKMSKPQREYLDATMADLEAAGKIALVAEGLADRFRWSS